jgi:hypothetical protein
MVRLAHLDWRILVQGFAAFLDAPVPAEHFAREYQGLTSSPRWNEASLGQ